MRQYDAAKQAFVDVPGFTWSALLGHIPNLEMFLAPQRSELQGIVRHRFFFLLRGKVVLWAVF
jgi:hypothetical protein